jgi:hypothetical protein
MAVAVRKNGIERYRRIRAGTGMKFPGIFPSGCIRPAKFNVYSGKT